MTVHRNSIVTLPSKCSLSMKDPSLLHPHDLHGSALHRLRSVPCAGILLAMLSGVFFATAGFIVKLVPKVNPIQIVVTRFVQIV